MAIQYKQDIRQQKISQFEELLEEKGINAFSLWIREVPKLEEDPRFMAIEAENERRELFEKFCREAGERKKKAEQERQSSAVKQFGELLEEIKSCDGVPGASKVSPNKSKGGNGEDVVEEGEALEDEEVGAAGKGSYLHSKTTLADLEKHWGKDQRWRDCPADVRENLFRDWIGPFRMRPPPKPQQQQKNTATAQFMQLLRETNLTGSSRWSKTQSQLDKDPRSQLLDKDVKKKMFRAYVEELRLKEEQANQLVKEAQNKERQLRERVEREQEEGKRRRNRAAALDAVENFKTLLQEQVKDPMGDYKAYRNKFKKDLQGRAVVNHLSSFQMEELFQKHVQNLYGKAVQDFKTFVINQFEVLNTEVDVQTLRAELRYYNSFQNYFSENPQMSSGLVAKLPEDVKYKVWSDCVDEFRRREKNREREDRERGGRDEQVKKQRFR